MNNPPIIMAASQSQQAMVKPNPAWKDTEPSEMVQDENRGRKWEWKRSESSEKVGVWPLAQGDNCPSHPFSWSLFARAHTHTHNVPCSYTNVVNLFMHAKSHIHTLIIPVIVPKNSSSSTFNTQSSLTLGEINSRLKDTCLKHDVTG